MLAPDKQREKGRERRELDICIYDASEFISAAMLLDGPSKNPLRVSSTEGHKFCPRLLAELKIGP
jgi:hypothetical protein